MLSTTAKMANAAPIASQWRSRCPPVIIIAARSLRETDSTRAPGSPASIQSYSVVPRNRRGDAPISSLAPNTGESGSCTPRALRAIPVWAG